MPQDDAVRLSALVVELRRLQRQPGPGTGQDAPDTRLPMSQKEVLRHVAAHPGTGTSAIARALQLAPNTVSGIVSALVAGGYLCREYDTRDKRAVRLRLTDTARERHAARWERRADVLEAALADLDDDRRAAIRDALPALEDLREVMRRARPDG